MPGKARRVASRQAQLGRRRKRQQTRPEDGQTVVSDTNTKESVQQEPEEVTSVAESTVLDVPDSFAEAPPEAPAPPARQTSRPPRPPRPSPVADRTVDAELSTARRGGRGRRERVTPQSNVGGEIKRILAMSSTVLAVIIVLGIFL